MGQGHNTQGNADVEQYICQYHTSLTHGKDARWLPKLFSVIHHLILKPKHLTLQEQLTAKCTTLAYSLH